MSLFRSHQRSVSRGSFPTAKPFDFKPSRPTRRQNGFTLIEILVTTVITLILIFSVIKMFQIVGESVAIGRAEIELLGQLRNTTRILQQDLDGITVAVRPGAQHLSGSGFVEFFEGPKSDRDRSGNGTTDVFDPLNSVFGDLDDVLTFTTRSKGRPFVGRVLGTLVAASGGGLTAIGPYFDGSGNPIFSTIESQDAEIIWFTAKYDKDESGSVGAEEVSALFRIVLPIRPDIDLSDITLPSPAGTAIQPIEFFHYNVISAHPSPSGNGFPTGSLVNFFAANSLSDLTIPQNRSLHVLNIPASPPSSNRSSYVTAFARPDPLLANALLFNNASLVPLASFPPIPLVSSPPVPGYLTSGIGETSILSNVVGFDMRVYDPTAQLWPDDTNSSAASEALAPGDPGFADARLAGIAAGNSALGTGAFVDMNYGSKIGLPSLSRFSGGPHVRSGLFYDDPSSSGFFPITTYDTWSMHYELDGIDSDQDFTVDEGADGLDNNGANGVDDPGERETSPPYPFPLRGMRVQIRVIESDSRQVRQASVVTDFTPE